ncbi:AAA family ATPase, partial [Marivirga lumbricoides]
PAHLLETKLSWDDLVLNPSTDEKLAELKDALLYKDQLSEEWGLGAHLKPGYRAIFYGPSGTGKSLTATLLGKMLDRDVYRVDLSAIISKYIGETEENLRKLLSKSEDKGYILFFDEGDALFGSRSDDVQNSNDQHQNQLIAYLLQAIENFNGIIILATNMKHNMDSAFSRRFQSSIFFGPPKPEQGLELWTRLWPEQLKKEPSLDFKLLASSKPFTAATIVQIVHNLALQAIRKNKYSVGMADIKRIVEELQRK